MRYYCGVDIGASAVKLVIIDQQRQVLARAVGRSGVDYGKSADRCLAEALAATGMEDMQFECSMSTGYGRNNVAWVCGSMTEIACHAKGAFHHFGQPMTVVDIGAQDSKMIQLDRGKTHRLQDESEMCRGYRGVSGRDRLAARPARNATERTR